MTAWLWSVIGDRRFRFVMVGGVNTVVGYTIFLLLDVLVFADLRFGYALSLTSSYILAMGLGFLLYRWLVFVDSQSWKRSLPRFILVTISSLMLNAFALFVLVEGAGFPRLLGQALAILLTVSLTYVGHALFSFAISRDRPENGPGVDAR
jgi:putative flippase GtrA